jgi:N-acetylmuramoyl-L-alanine amidase
VRDINLIFVHTLAFDGNAGVADVRRWHRQQGWTDIGYHYLVRRSGDVEIGRPESQAGAHVAGANAASIGVACEGHHDREAHTPLQRSALLALLRHLMRQFDVSAGRVLGHNEVNTLIALGHVDRKYRTSKTCPGVRVDMNEIRAALMGQEWPDLSYVREPVVKMEDTLPRMRALELTEQVERGTIAPGAAVVVMGALPPADVRWVGPGYAFELVEDYRLDPIDIPSGFQFDAGSVPRVFWAAISPLCLGIVSVLVHDWLYATGGQDGLKDRSRADRLFLEHMAAEDVSRARRNAAFIAVRLAGGPHWRG